MATPPSPYTLGDLKAELQPILWPTGEAENLIGAHAAMFVEALIDLQQWVECQQINNTQIVPACNTLFKCGLTVTDAPRGRIRRVYTIDHINQTTGLEDNLAPLDWCSTVEGLQIDYSDLDYYVSQTLANALDAGFFGWWSGALNGVFAFPTLFNWWNKKYIYPPPTDAGLTGAPTLPLGYHYSQSSTDNPSGRAQSFLWSLKGGQIFIAPWIQSTEVIVIEWDGLKRVWNDTDIVDNDPLLKQAIEAYVMAEHARKYDHDYDAAGAAMEVYKEKRSQLMYECERENEIREGNQSSKARGASSIVPTFVNDAQSATASCPDGTSGSPVSVTVNAGSVVSLLSVADANARAASLALQQAGSQLNCVVTPPTFTNSQQTFTANCPNGSDGFSVTSTVQADTITSFVSQADANQQAFALAQSQAQSQLVCSFINAAQTFNGTCGDGTTHVTATVPAGAFNSTISQQDADAKALTAAQNTALATCPAQTSFPNTIQVAQGSYFCSTNHQLLTASAVVGAGSVYATTQAAANAQALAAAQQVANAAARSKCPPPVLNPFQP